MISINNIVTVIWIHFLADFLLQGTFISMNKSKKISVLIVHCFIYSIPFIYISPEFALINGIKL